MADNKDLSPLTKKVDEDNRSSSSKEKENQSPGNIIVKSHEGRAYPLAEIRPATVIFKKKKLTNGPCRSTIQRWKKHMKEEGTLFPRKSSDDPQDKMTGHPLFLLAVYYRIYPDAPDEEIIAYLWRVHGKYLHNPYWYNPSQISQAKQKLGISREKLATATAAQQRESKAKFIQDRKDYWCQPYPLGIDDIKAKDLIDIGEAGVMVDAVNQEYWKTKVVSRGSCQGPFGHGNALSLIMAISGDPDDKLCWYDLEERQNFTQCEILHFILRVLNDIPPGTNERRRCFIMDPIPDYKYAVILNSILQVGHRFVFRAQTYTNDGPIQSVFQTIETLITPNIYPVDNVDHIRAQIQQCIQSVSKFYPRFYNCGYR